MSDLTTKRYCYIKKGKPEISNFPQYSPKTAPQSLTIIIPIEAKKCKNYLDLIYLFNSSSLGFASVETILSYMFRGNFS